MDSSFTKTIKSNIATSSFALSTSEELAAALFNSCLNVVLRSRLVWVELLLAFPRVPVTPTLSSHKSFFLLCCPLNAEKQQAVSLKSVACFLSCLSLTRLFILLLLMSDNVYPNSGPSLPVQCALEM